eukprot:gb/GECG01014752.1/.p1 GENE.gb/GECG01014752.1/~~gb/GECG01014752.1/.p1  ORF type:complete len:469 (+),score=64.55 gb/GECG01014752.1/:1-1407(+)
MGVDALLYDIECSDISVEKVDITMKDNLQAKIQNVSAKCPGKWKVSSLLLSGHGTADVTVQTAKGSLDISATTNSSGHLALTASDVKFDMGNVTVNMKGSGVSGKIIEWLEGLLQGWIIKTAEKTIEQQLTELINVNITHILQELPTSVDFPLPAPYNVSALNLGATSVTQASSAFLGAGFQGFFADKNDPSTLPPFVFPQLPPYAKSSVDSSFVQTLISNNTIGSAIWVLQRNGLLSKTVYPDDIPSHFPLQLYTNSPDWKYIAPKLNKVYPNDPMHLVLSIEQGSEVRSSKSKDSFFLNSSLSMDFQAVENEPVTAFRFSCPLETTLSLDVQQGKGNGSEKQLIVGEIKSVSCDVTIVNSSVGKVDYSGLRRGVNFILRYLLKPIINKVLEGGIPLPCGSTLKLKNSSISFDNDYAVLGTMAEIDLPSLLGSGVSVPADALPEREVSRLRREFQQEVKESQVKWAL